MLNLITDHLDVWASAELPAKSGGRGRAASNTKSPHGIQKLRELILELAVRGKLVAQDPNDEPASTLLKKIEREKTRLVHEGKLAKQKPLPSVNDEEKRFGLPNGWEWIRVGNLFELEYGSNLPEAKRANTGEYPVYGSNGVVGSHDSCCVDQPCIVVGRKGSAGALNLCLSSGCWVTDVAYSVVPPADMDLEFVFKLFHTLGLDNLGKGIKPGLNRNEAYVLPVAIPPLAEQRRIVAKVDELMALCDQLEQEQTDNSNAHQTLVETLLATLTQAEGEGDFATAWQRIAAHFDTLFTSEQSIDQLKQAILQLAVMGKLVPQDHNDEPASALLKKMREEKQCVISEGKIRNEKDLIDFRGLDELKRPLPSTWEWVRLADIGDVVRGGSPRPAGDPRFYDGDIPFLKVADVSRVTGKFVEGHTYTIKELGLKKTRFIDERTVLLTNSGATLGIPAICDFPTTFNDGIAAFVQLSSGVFDEYLYLYLSSLSQWFLDIASRGQGQPNLNTDIIKATWFALPPLSEQRRIVAKVDELMAICDALKARLNEAQITQVQLADAIVEQAVA